MLSPSRDDSARSLDHGRKTARAIGFISALSAGVPTHAPCGQTDQFWPGLPARQSRSIDRKNQPTVIKVRRGLPRQGKCRRSPDVYACERHNCFRPLRPAVLSGGPKRLQSSSQRARPWLKRGGEDHLPSSWEG